MRGLTLRYYPLYLNIDGRNFRCASFPRPVSITISISISLAIARFLLQLCRRIVRGSVGGVESTGVCGKVCWWRGGGVALSCKVIWRSPFRVLPIVRRDVDRRTEHRIVRIERDALHSVN